MSPAHPSAEAGSHAHFAATEGVKLGLRALNACPEQFPDVALEHWPGVLLFVKNVVGTLQSLRIFGGDNLGIERQLGDASFGGTPDIDVYSERDRLLIIWDFKNGHGPVEAFENWQGISYAKLLNPPPDTAIQIRVVQPNVWSRTGPIKIWKTSKRKLQPYFRKLQSAMSQARSDTPPAQTGPHCRYCKGRPRCGQQQSEGMAWAEMIAGPEPILQTPNEIGQELTVLHRAWETLRARIDSLEEQAKWHIGNGRTVWGYHVDRGLGALQWTDERAAICAAAKEGVNISKLSAITPTQAKKAGVDPNIITQYAKRGPGKVKLAQDDTAEARRIFSDN